MEIVILISSTIIPLHVFVVQTRLTLRPFSIAVALLAQVEQPILISWKISLIGERQES